MEVLDEEKQNASLILIQEQDDIDKIYLYAKDLSEPKYELLIKKREDAGAKHLNDSNAFIECANNMDDVYESIVYEMDDIYKILCCTKQKTKNLNCV